jgi:hypothetical protein
MSAGYPPPPFPPGQGVPPPLAPAARRKSPLAILALVLGGGFLALLLCGGLVVGFGWYAATGSQETVSEAERGLVPTVEQLSPWLDPDFVPRSDAGQLTKTRYFDGSTEVSYEYEHADEARPLYVMSGVHFEASPSDASTTYVALSASFGIGLQWGADGPMEQEERNDLFAWGDESRLTLLVYNGQTIGNFFVARKGSRVVYFIVSGLYFDEPEALAELLQPHLDRLDAHVEE